MIIDLFQKFQWPVWPWEMACIFSSTWLRYQRCLEEEQWHLLLLQWHRHSRLPDSYVPLLRREGSTGLHLKQRWTGVHQHDGVICLPKQTFFFVFVLFIGCAGDVTKTLRVRLLSVTFLDIADWDGTGWIIMDWNGCVWDRSRPVPVCLFFCIDTTHTVVQYGAGRCQDC